MPIKDMQSFLYDLSVPIQVTLVAVALALQS